MTRTREALRSVFDEDALLYDRARPHYLDVAFDAIDRALADARSREPGLGSRVLEIGPGTGQATVPLTARGYDVTAVELGPGLAEVARARLAGTGAEVITADVERWDGPAGAYDLVVCATAFHWLDPATRLDRVARWLRPGGVVALLQTRHVAGPSDAFFAAAQRCYERWDPATPEGLRLERIDDLPPTGPYGLEDAGPGFTGAALHRFPVDHTYTADTYLDLLSTFSGHRTLDPEHRAGLFGCLRRLIEAEPGATIVRSSAIELATATRRRSSAPPSPTTRPAAPAIRGRGLPG